MTVRSFAASIGLLAGATTFTTACTSADLQAIRQPAPDGGTGAAGRSGGAGGKGGAAGSGGAGGGPVLPGCPSTALVPGDTTETMQVGSATRSYVLHVPPLYSGATRVPLIIDFHALGGTGPSQRKSSKYPPVTDPDGVVMVFPTGLPGPAGPAWNVGPCCVADVDDVAFTRALVRQVSQRACIDAGRIYAVGFSMGGGMAHYLACQAADVFAAVAPSAFDLLEENSVGCPPGHAMTVISFRGTADTVVPYDGGRSTTIPGMPVTFLGAVGTFQKWAEIDNCQGAPSAEDADGCSTYSSCRDGAEVTLCTKEGGNQEQGNASVAWPVLKRHSL